LPRRFAQRQTLRHGRGGAPPTLPNGEEQPRAYESRVKLKRRNRARKSNSAYDGNSGPDSDSAKDSGYNSLSDSESDSESDVDTEAMDVERMMREFEEEGVTLSNPCDETKAMMEVELEKWEEIMQDPHRALKMCEASYFKTYLFWRVKHSRIKKESSIITRWKFLSMKYAQLAEEYMNESVLYDMRNWIPQVLTPTFGLDDSEKEKSGLFVEDLCRLQNAHWVRDTEVFAHERLRVQLSPFLALAGCTATRPKALVGLRYEDIEFQLFPPRVKGRPPIVIMKLNLKRVKRSGGKRKG
ncbi:hypothetical protein B0J14DRAFT_675844, partial [Halenospora varia]